MVHVLVPICPTRCGLRARRSVFRARHGQEPMYASKYPLRILRDLDTTIFLKTSSCPDSLGDETDSLHRHRRDLLPNLPVSAPLLPPVFAYGVCNLCTRQRALRDFTGAGRRSEWRAKVEECARILGEHVAEMHSGCRQRAAKSEAFALRLSQARHCVCVGVYGGGTGAHAGDYFGAGRPQSVVRSTCSRMSTHLSPQSSLCE
ncbi:hypothetical protein EDB89DRAFT_306875 [Lactarius sanguifluus]|nr:hypothetical protein EDB89DRAFT_306875 [Lactarius sanguifluus]